MCECTSGRSFFLQMSQHNQVLQQITGIACISTCHRCFFCRDYVRCTLLCLLQQLQHLPLVSDSAILCDARWSLHVSQHVAGNLCAHSYSAGAERICTQQAQLDTQL